MAAEQTKAAKRRFNEGVFHLRYFAGHGMDIGGKPDPLGKYVKFFSRMQSCRTWDIEDGDAQFLAGVMDNTLDFVHSSHCLEHLHDPLIGLTNWIRVLKPGGYVIATVPDEELYERGHWPSRFNSDHKRSFSTHNSTGLWSVNLLALLSSLSHLAAVERLILQRDFFDDSLPNTVDQTKTGNAECSIEFVLRKK